MPFSAGEPGHAQARNLRRSERCLDRRVRKTPLLSNFYTKTINLPRQARTNIGQAEKRRRLKGGVLCRGNATSNGEGTPRGSGGGRVATEELTVDMASCVSDVLGFCYSAALPTPVPSPGQSTVAWHNDSHFHSKRSTMMRPFF
jgi:hypothetical protein